MCMYPALNGIENVIEKSKEESNLLLADAVRQVLSLLEGPWPVVARAALLVLHCHPELRVHVDLPLALLVHDALPAVRRRRRQALAAAVAQVGPVDSRLHAAPTARHRVALLGHAPLAELQVAVLRGRRRRPRLGRLVARANRRREGGDGAFEEGAAGREVSDQQTDAHLGLRPGEDEAEALEEPGAVVEPKEVLETDNGRN